MIIIYNKKCSQNQLDPWAAHKKYGKFLVIYYKSITSPTTSYSEA